MSIWMIKSIKLNEEKLMQAPATVRTILGISGSLRRESCSTAVLRRTAELAPPSLAVREFPLHGIPLYNQDDDATYGVATELASIRAFREAIEASDGLLIVSPEFNYGIPGVLKNALDWASRPGYRSPLKRKPVMVITNSPGVLGGARAQSQLRETLYSTLARVIVRPELIIAGVKQKLAEPGFDEATCAFVREAFEELLAEIEMTGAGA